MSENNSKVKNILIPTVVLFSICLIITLALAVTNALTKDRIEALNKEKLAAAMSEVIPADSYEGIYLDGEDTSADPSIYEALDAKGERAGIILITAAKGYGGDVTVMTGIAEEEILSVKVTDCSGETPGLGQNANKPDFTDQFTGVSGSPSLTKGAPQDNEVAAITGATITSSAVVDAVKEAMELYRQIA